MSLMIFMMGLLGALVAFITYSIPSIRNVETIVPDFVLPPAEEATPPSPPGETPPRAEPSPSLLLTPLPPAVEPAPLLSSRQLLSEAATLAGRGQTKSAISLLRQCIASRETDQATRQVASWKLASLLYLIGKDRLADQILLHYREEGSIHGPR